MMTCIYLIGALKNEKIATLGIALREELACEVFNEWYSAGPRADEHWQAHERLMGRTYREAFDSYHAQDVFAFDKRHLDRSDAGILVMPAGKSGHLELGYMAGRGKPTFVLFESEPERYDIMYRFANAVCFSRDELIAKVKKVLSS